MRKLFAEIALLLAMAALARGADAATQKTFFANDYGAKGDGTTLDTAAIPECD